MNKLLTFTTTLIFVFVNSAFASSTIHLPVANEVTIVPHAEKEVSLDALVRDVPYMVSCTLHSTSPNPSDMDFSPRLAPKGGFGVMKLNDKSIVQHIGALQNGENTLTFLVSVPDNHKQETNAFVFKNLDNRFSVTLKACQAQPASNVTTAANRMSGGYFYITNYLPCFLDVSIGNFIPTNYCIPPFSKAYIETSTSYQNIDIVGTHY